MEFDDLIDEFDSHALAQPMASATNDDNSRIDQQEQSAITSEDLIFKSIPPLPLASDHIEKNLINAPLPKQSSSSKLQSFSLAKKQDEAKKLALLHQEKIQIRKNRQLAIAKECARRRTWLNDNNKSNNNDANDPSPPPEDFKIANQLSLINFATWSGVFYAFEADKSHPLSKVIENEAQTLFSSPQPQESSLLFAFCMCILRDKSVDSSCLYTSIPSLMKPKNSTYQHEFFSVTSSVGIVFETMMGRLLDRANLCVNNQEISQQTWETLLLAARHEVSAYIKLMTNMILHRIPCLKMKRMRDNRLARFVVWEAVEESICELLEIALPLFYRQYYSAQDDLIYSKCGSDMDEQTFDPSAIELLKRGLDFDTPSPFRRLDLIIQGVRLISSQQQFQVGGDELLPLIISAVQSIHPLHLASRVYLMYDLLPEDLLVGEEAFTISLLQSAVEALK